MRNDFNPWPVMASGQQVEQNLAQAESEGLSWRERLAMKRASAAMGNQNYFAGYEGVPGAKRPDYLKQAYADADPAQAMQLEGMIAEPFKLNRAAEQAGKIEAARDAAKFGSFGSFVDSQRAKWMPQPPPGATPGEKNEMTSRLEGASVAAGGAIPEQNPHTDPYASLRNPRPKMTEPPTEKCLFSRTAAASVTS